MPPTPNVNALVAGLESWTTRADFAVMQDNIPWHELLDGTPAEDILQRAQRPLADYYRGKAMKVVLMVDPSDGFSRGQDDPALRALGRSFTEAPIQQLYRDYVVAAARLLRPDVIGLLAESNLIRAVAPPALYKAFVAAANDAAADLRRAEVTAALIVSVQVETAWGLLAGSGAFEGIAQDLADFPFVQRLGLSSYPYFAFGDPDDIPGDYYRRLLANSGLRAIVVEGGWTSSSFGAVVSSQAKQAHYVARHAQLLDSIDAIGVAQLIYADPDLAALPQPLPANLKDFANIGLTDSSFNAKPARASWDALFSLRLVS